MLRANPDGSVLRVRDVARVEMGAQNEDTETRINGRAGASASRSISRPTPTRCRPRRASTETLARLQQRFPAGHARRTIVYDSTVFVSDTIHEVLRTLAEAFVLVVIVVFLFLGNLRATIIPAVAVPVSLIGTFAVLLAMGYSANTVSLLAMVLAIGIVVDDAIVVVENVERVLEEEPRPHAGRGDAQGDAPDHRADHRHHAGAAVGVRAGRLHPRHLRPAVPPVRRHHQRRHADLRRQRADAVAGALRASCCATGAARAARWRWVLRGIDEVRDGYAGVVRRLVRVAVALARR